MRTAIKICGITRPEDARCALDLGADRIGIISCASSPRNIDAKRMQTIAHSIANRQLVLVVVDMPLSELLDLYDPIQKKIERIQFHGSETPESLMEVVRHLPNVEIIKRIHSLEEVRKYDRIADRFLLEPRGDLPGGNGKSFHWEDLGRLDPSDRFILAGGLNPENVLDALRTTGVGEIDVCGGVEEKPGIKDRIKMEKLINRIRNEEKES